MHKYLIILAFSLLATSLTAQEFRAGPLLGTSFSQVDGDNFVGYNKVGINLGGFVSRPINDKWTIQLDIAYMQKGSREAPKPDKGKYDDYKIHISNFLWWPGTDTRTSRVRPVWPLLPC
ncbi:MAG: PorT family protein [Carboxylicivirga sp.]|jgi:hypothetical protein|nr:PorT family protein [Carboxylicivirga sp.]